MDQEPGFTAPASVCIPDVIGALACGFQTQQQKKGGGRGPSLKNHPQNGSILGWFFRGGPLPPGSWLGNIVNRKPPQEGVVLSIKFVSFIARTLT